MKNKGAVTLSSPVSLEHQSLISLTNICTQIWKIELNMYYFINTCLLFYRTTTVSIPSLQERLYDCMRLTTVTAL